MGIGDKISNMAEKAKGKGQQAAGKARDDEGQQAEGLATQDKADAKQTGEHLKDGDLGSAADSAKKPFDR